MAENTRNEETPNDEDLRTKKPTTSSNQSRATVKGNIEDVVAYINKAREAQEIAAHDLETANNWLNKSQELLAEVLAAISVRDTPKETQSINPDAVVDNVDTNVNGLNPDTNPEQARIENNYKEAETHNTLEAEQLQTEVKVFPAKPKNYEKPTVSPSYAGVTVEGNPEDVVACIDNAKKAFAEKDLEKAKKWLIKSQCMRYTVNAQELLNQVMAAVAARDEIKETLNVNTNAGPDNDNTNSIADPNPEQARTRTPTEPPSGPTVHNDDVGAKKFIDNANKAFKAGDFDKAERLFLKAKRMDANIDVEQYLKLVHESKARDNAVPEPIEQTNHNMDEANTYLTVAENAFNYKRYKRALKFLDKSEALFTLERAVKLREQVQDAMSNPTIYKRRRFVENCTNFTREKPSKPNSSLRFSLRSRKEELDELETAIRNDIDAGNLDEAERKLQTPGFVKAVQLKKLRIEVEEKKTLRRREDKPKTEQSNPKSVEQVEPPQNEMLNNIRAEEANNCIEVAVKAYYNGDLDKAERLLKKAERLYPTERAKTVLEIVYNAKEEKKRLETTESTVNNEVQKRINSGLDHIEKKNYYSAKLAFERAKHLQPGNKYIEGLLTDVQTMIKKINAITLTRTFSIPESTVGTSTGTQNRQNEKPTNESEQIAAANKYTDWAQEAYNYGDIENAENFLKPAAVYNSTERVRKLYIMILKAKLVIKTNESDCDGTIEGKGYLRSAEDAFIKGEFKIAKDLLSKPEVTQGPYVTELTERIKNELTRNRNWYDKLMIF